MSSFVGCNPMHARRIVCCVMGKYFSSIRTARWIPPVERLNHLRPTRTLDNGENVFLRILGSRIDLRELDIEFDLYSVRAIDRLIVPVFFSRLLKFFCGFDLLLVLRIADDLGINVGDAFLFRIVTGDRCVLARGIQPRARIPPHVRIPVPALAQPDRTAHRIDAHEPSKVEGVVPGVHVVQMFLYLSQTWMLVRIGIVISS